jgi:Cu2+-exporting ATPase
MVHTLGLLTFIGWQMSGAGWESALTAAIAVLIITCPCALALAVPAVQVAATSRLFAHGVLVKTPDALERLGEIDTIVLDKTGTLTLGRPSLVDATALDIARLTAAAALAANSRHPFARAIVRGAESRGWAVRPATNVTEVAGYGLERDTAAGRERLGSALWCGADVAETPATVWYRSTNGSLTGFAFSDQVRPDGVATVQALSRAKLATEVLSGDRESVVRATADTLGITRWRAHVLPTDKIARLKELAGSGAKVLMVGDGLNDAPALATAHASLSPATAADISQTAADAIFQGDSLAPVVEAIAVARSAQRMAKQNFAIALGYNAVFVPLAIAGHVTPLLAAIAMSASSLAVTANALRLRTKKVSLS